MADRIDVDVRIHPGQAYTSPNGKYSLILQNDSNLVLYKKNDDGGNQQAIWASNTYEGDDSATNKSVILQADGNFVLYNAGGQPIWKSDTGGYDGMSKPYVMVQDDGNVVMYDEGRDGAVWATNTHQEN